MAENVVAVYRASADAQADGSRQQHAGTRRHRSYTLATDDSSRPNAAPSAAGPHSTSTPQGKKLDKGPALSIPLTVEDRIAPQRRGRQEASPAGSEII